MKELSLKEAAFLCHSRGIRTMNRRGWGGGLKTKGKGGALSLEMLTESESSAGWVNPFDPNDTMNRLYRRAKRDPSCDGFDDKSDRGQAGLSRLLQRHRIVSCMSDVRSLDQFILPTQLMTL